MSLADRTREQSRREKGLCAKCAAPSSTFRCQSCKPKSANKASLQRKYRFNIGTAEYSRRLAEQGNKCAACGRPADETMCIDHDHALDAKHPLAFRGIVHRNCNVALGFAGDDPQRLRNLAVYLERHLRFLAIRSEWRAA